MSKEFRKLSRKLLNKLRAISQDRNRYSLSFRIEAYCLYNLLSDFTLEVLELSRINRKEIKLNE